MKGPETMSKFETYFLMNDQDVIEYVKEKLDIFPADAVLTSRRSETETSTMFSELRKSQQESQ